MKNQYFGDINDYEKFGILRAVSDAGRTPVYRRRSRRST